MNASQRQSWRQLVDVARRNPVPPIDSRRIAEMVTKCLAQSEAASQTATTFETLFSDLRWRTIGLLASGGVACSGFVLWHAVQSFQQHLAWARFTGLLLTGFQ